jgi:hypothetical protein
VQSSSQPFPASHPVKHSASAGQLSRHLPRSTWQNGAQYVDVQPFRQPQNASQQPSEHDDVSVVQISWQTVHSSASHSAQVAEGTWVQPTSSVQASSVQDLWSVQSRGAPLVHAPPAHTSPSVHGLPSSHGFALGVNTQAPPAQASLVQGFRSLHTIGWPAHWPFEQASLAEHACR